MGYLKDCRIRKLQDLIIYPGNILKSFGLKAKGTLFGMTHKMYKKGELPLDFELTLMISIRKAQNCEEYITVSLISHASKILTRIIFHRMEKKIGGNLQKYQVSFRRNRRAREAILSLRVFMEKSLRLTKKSFVDIDTQHAPVRDALVV